MLTAISYNAFELAKNMIEFLLNDQPIRTSEAPASALLDFVRYHEQLKGTKIGCREGDCGACTVLVGELAPTARP